MSNTKADRAKNYIKKEKKETQHLAEGIVMTNYRGTNPSATEQRQPDQETGGDMAEVHRCGAADQSGAGKVIPPAGNTQRQEGQNGTN